MRQYLPGSGTLVLASMVIISITCLGFAFLGFLSAQGERSYGGIPHDKTTTTESFVRDGRQFPVVVESTRTRTGDTKQADAQPSG